MAERIKKILVVIILIFLFVPKLQKIFPVIAETSLKGVFKTAPNVDFSTVKWMDGSYQEAKNNYLNDNFIFRPNLIKLNCQIDYSLFYKLNTGWCVLGKNNCLLTRDYIDAWTGADFVGYRTICERMIKLKALQDTFSKLGKSLVLVHAASKAFYYSDCLPDDMIPAEKRPTNFATYMHVGDSLGVNQLDLNSWFCALKKTSRELLYPKQGLHWSMYGGLLAADTLAGYIENLRKIKIPHPRWKDITHSQHALLADDDLAAMLNLTWPFTTETFTYGKMVCDDDNTRTRLSAIYIGDSFTWSLVDDNVFDCMNSNWEFWYYFRQRYNRGGSPRNAMSMENYDWQGAIDKADCIVLLYSAAILDVLGSGFIENEYSHYYPEKQRL